MVRGLPRFRVLVEESQQPQLLREQGPQIFEGCKRYETAVKPREVRFPDLKITE